jgi:hypothetical protein
VLTGSSWIGSSKVVSGGCGVDLDLAKALPPLMKEMKSVRFVSYKDSSLPVSRGSVAEGPSSRSGSGPPRSPLPEAQVEQLVQILEARLTTLK